MMVKGHHDDEVRWWRFVIGEYGKLRLQFVGR